MDGENAAPPPSSAAAAATARALGLPVSAAWADAALAAKQQQSAGVPPPADARAALLSAFLTADLNACGDGVGSLPADLNAFNGRTLEGRFVLQVDEVLNTAAPAKQRYDHAPHPRLLKLLLTDGARQAVAFEFEPCPALGSGPHPAAWIAPGAKLVLADPPVSGGMLALRPAHVGVLGGRVGRLSGARDRAVAAWRAPPTGGSVVDGTAESAYVRARAAAWGGDGRPGPAPVQAQPPAPPPPPPPPPAPAREQKPAPPLVVAAQPPPPAPRPAPAQPAAPAGRTEVIVVGSDSEEEEAPLRPTGPPPAWPLCDRPPPSGRALLPAPPARIDRAASNLRFMSPDGGPLAGGLAMDVVLKLGDGGESAAAVDGAVLEAVLRGEAGGGNDGGASTAAGGGAATTAPPPPASTPAELIALYATAGPEAMLGRIRGLRAALSAFHGDGCFIGVEGVGEGGGGVRVVGLWRQ